MTEDVASAARALRGVVDGVAGAPDTTADPLHLAYLRGAADALELVAEGTDRGSPDSFGSGHLGRDHGGTASGQVG